jgi:hypothetical protein
MRAKQIDKERPLEEQNGKSRAGKNNQNQNNSGGRKAPSGLQALHPIHGAKLAN